MEKRLEVFIPDDRMDYDTFNEMIEDISKAIYEVTGTRIGFGVEHKYKHEGEHWYLYVINENNNDPDFNVKAPAIEYVMLKKKGK